MGLWMQENNSCSLPCCFYREKAFLQDSGPVSMACVFPHIRGTSESPFIIHLLVFLTLIFAGALVLSVGSNGHPEQFLPSSSSSSPFLGCVTPSLQALLPGFFWELHFLWIRERLEGGNSLFLGHSWDVLVLLGQPGALTGVWDSILDVQAVFQTQPGLQPLKVRGVAG